MTRDKKTSKWQEMYKMISSEFGYDVKSDTDSARMLERILYDAKIPDAYDKLHHAIYGKAAFVIGSGPSLAGAFDAIAKYAGLAVVISADTALKHLVRRGIFPDVVVSDMDGHIKSHEEASQKGAVMVIHAHADNTRMLYHAKKFGACVGTTQTEPFGRMYNFGGFTDGDRAVFAADHFGASRTILFGMDFGCKVGSYSDTATYDHTTKIRKMKVGKTLMEEWLPYSPYRYTTSSDTLRGFEQITYDDIPGILR